MLRVAGAPTVLVQVVKVCVPVVSTPALGGYNFTLKSCQSMLISI